MNRVSETAILIFLLAGTLVGCGAPSGPRIRIEDAWARPAMALAASAQSSGEGAGMAGTGAIFMRLVNEGKEPDRLVGGKTDVAGALEIHETVMEGDVTKMQMLANRLDVPARGEVLLQPGGYHIMLIGLHRDLKVGDKVNVELQLEKSGTLTVQAQVREP